MDETVNEGDSLLLAGTGKQPGADREEEPALGQRQLQAQETLEDTPIPSVRHLAKNLEQKSGPAAVPRPAGSFTLRAGSAPQGPAGRLLVSQRSGDLARENERHTQEDKHRRVLTTLAVKQSTPSRPQVSPSCRVSFEKFSRVRKSCQLQRVPFFCM